MRRKFIIELEDKNVWTHGHPQCQLAFDMEVFGTKLTPTATGIELTPYTEPDIEAIKKQAYEQGANDQRKQDEAEMMLLGSASVGAYESGLKKAWETALKLVLLPVDGGIGAVDLIEIFNYSSYVDILKTFSVNEVIQKIQQYEDEKREELKFGDEVIAKKGGDSDAKKACVMYPNDGKSQCLVLKDTGTTEWWSKCWIRKTGRNYPEIEEVLKKMRE